MSFSNKYVVLPIKTSKSEGCRLRLHPFQIESYYPTKMQFSQTEVVVVRTKSGATHVIDKNIEAFEEVLTKFHNGDL